MAPDANPDCSVCGNGAPQPLLICFECSEGTDINGIVTPTGYCSPNCRSADKDHARMCKIKNDRKCLYRAGDLLQAVLYEWLETAATRKVTSVWKNEGILCFAEETPGTDNYLPIPDSMFETLQDKHKVLALHACNGAMVNILELTHRALRGLATKTRELGLFVNRNSLAVHRYINGKHFDEYTPNHEAWYATLNEERDEFVLDISSAQYGLCCPVMPFRKYLSSGGFSQAGANKLGQAAKARASINRQKIRKHIADFWDADAAMRPRFKAAIDEWETLQSQTVSEFLSSSKPKYEKGKHILLAMVHDAIQTCIDGKERADFTINEQAISINAAEEKVVA